MNLTKNDTLNAIVLEGTNNVFTVQQGDNIFSCTLKSKRLKTSIKYYNPIATGDIVEIQVDPIDKTKAQILNVKERKTEFLRLNTKKNLPQVIVANVDLILLVTTVQQPTLKTGFLERVLLQAQRQNIPVVIVCAKCDLIDKNQPPQQKQLQYFDLQKTLGCKVFFVSAKDGTGIKELLSFLQDNNYYHCSLIGQSGVGKSSLINAFCKQQGQNQNLATGELSFKTGKGKHTTTKSTLIKIKGKKQDIFIIDTPGIKNFVLYDIKKNDLALYFSEMRPFVGKCQFGLSCSHTHEAGCAILKAVLAGAVSKTRYKSYLQIRQEIGTY